MHANTMAGYISRERERELMTSDATHCMQSYAYVGRCIVNRVRVSERDQHHQSECERRMAIKRETRVSGCMQTNNGRIQRESERGGRERERDRKLMPSDATRCTQ